MYFSAEEDAGSSSDPVFPTLTPQSFHDIHSSESESLVWGKDEQTPTIIMNTSGGTSVAETTVLERNQFSSSSNSTLSFMSADTDPDETLSDGGLQAEDLSMVDLRNQVSTDLIALAYCIC